MWYSETRWVLRIWYHFYFALLLVVNNGAKDLPQPAWWEVFELDTSEVTGSFVLQCWDSGTVLNLPRIKLNKKSLPFPPNQTLTKSHLMPIAKRRLCWLFYFACIASGGENNPCAWQLLWWLLGKFHRMETSKAIYCCLKGIHSPKPASGEPLSPII